MWNRSSIVVTVLLLCCPIFVALGEYVYGRQSLQELSAGMAAEEVTGKNPDVACSAEDIACAAQDDAASMLAMRAVRSKEQKACGGENPPCNEVILPPLSDSFIFLLFQAGDTNQNGIVDDAELTHFLNLGGCLKCAELLLGSEALQLRQVQTPPPTTTTPTTTCPEFTKPPCPQTTTTTTTTVDPVEVQIVVEELLPAGPADYPEFLQNVQNQLGRSLGFSQLRLQQATAALVSHHGKEKAKALLQTKSQQEQLKALDESTALDQSTGSKACV